MDRKGSDEGQGGDGKMETVGSPQKGEKIEKNTSQVPTEQVSPSFPCIKL